MPGSMEEAFVADGARRTLGDTWNPGDPEWKEDFEAHRMLHEAGLAGPSVNLDAIREALSDLDEARQKVDAVFGEDDKVDEGP